ncbi:lysM and putative peptidoglycan-binding domain-containing protein 3 [Leptinotarsa decemlineata]|uniref:lysM and putative peptidoglycan-binding domain-containing protein 3 n=1 Tax=Leptinotarsa decemlineata TaxID=7539 RepID=UPI000C252657|nr:lysM and putative peptidoglycan-binding domain-containing protein 3 [Leptinotarsa decemlineata]
MMKQRQKNKIYDGSYKYLYKEKESGSDSGDEIELYLSTKPQKIDTPTIEKVVEEGDTLQALAIRYHCNIGDLKRINSIQNDNEIFAKRIIKVPYRPFTMALAGVHVSGRSSPDAVQPSTSKLVDIDSVNTKLNQEISEVNEIIFNSQITHKIVERHVEDVCEEDCDDQVNLLPQNERTLPENDVFSKLNCNGADAGISWKILIICIVIVVLALPLIYVFYIAEHPDEYHHHSS